MSGFLPDLASWALRGGAGNEEANENDSQQEQQGPHLTDDEIRARRLARMEALQQQEQQEQQYEQEPEPMEVEGGASDKMDVDVDEDKKPAAIETTRPKSMPADVTPPKPAAAPTKPSPESEQKKKRTKESPDPARKLQKKKELLIKRVLSIALAESSTTSDSSCTVVDVGDTTITVQTVADILSTRLSMSENIPKGIIPYLGQCHKRAGEELKTLKQLAPEKRIQGLEDILEEIRSQAVSYAASTLMVPDLFPKGKNSSTQLAKCLLSVSTDVSTSITFGVSGKESSFYYCLCEELLSQDQSIFESVITDIVSYLANSLSKLDNVVDTAEGAEDGAVVAVSALAALCSHKKAALCMTQMENFVLPEAGTAKATEKITPPAPVLPPGATRQQQQLFRMMQMMSRNNAGYLRRSGPALEKETILGMVLRLGCPREDPTVVGAFPSVAAPLDAVENTANQMRRQLQVYQDTCHQLMRSLITAGADARKRVSGTNIAAKNKDVIMFSISV
jgi:hypothetical protein